MAYSDGLTEARDPAGEESVKSGALMCEATCALSPTDLMECLLSRFINSAPARRKATTHDAGLELYGESQVR